MMTKIKICGLSRLQDIEVINEIKPDFIGFVFADFSHRYIDKAAAKKLKAALDPEIKAVGVFVDEDVNETASYINENIIDMVQLHGNEDDTYISRLRAECSRPVEIIKAFNFNKTKDIKIIENSAADYVMIDSGCGTGEVFDWSKLGNIKRPFFLAGGLGCENVSDAIKTIHPFAVDVSSGVEIDKLKDPEKMNGFVKTVREFG